MSNGRICSDNKSKKQTVFFVLCSLFRTFAPEIEKDMRILGIRRELNFSPNLAGNDAAIFMGVADELKVMGHEVAYINENEMVNTDFEPYDRVVTMARDVHSLTILKEKNVEKQTQFFNSVEGILACSDKAMVATIMQQMDIPQPAFIPSEDRKLPISEEGVGDIPYPVWLKKCDGCAEQKWDTIFCQSMKETCHANKIMKRTHYQRWMAQAHQKGDLVKFYGVEGTDFFRWQYASHGHSKFGYEEINGPEMGYPFDSHRIKEYADRLAKQLNVPIYGGDVIIDENGEPWFIDFNDFPSFSSCREQASKVIARRVVQGLEF